MPKTYWHLAARQRIPTAYEIVTTKLHYYTSKGFELNLPIAAFYEKYQKGCPLRLEDWDRFYDPREAIYSTYVSQQREKEIFAERILQSMEQKTYADNLNATCLGYLEKILAPLRYPCHALQMLAAYVAQMAPSGRLTIVGLLQSSDEMRRIHLLAYRLAQLQQTHPTFGIASRSTWEQAVYWQPLRSLLERMLIVYDWGEAWTALNLVLKPMFDELFMIHFAALAAKHRDHLLVELFASLYEDCCWHQEWSQALLQLLLKSDHNNFVAIEQWMRCWQPQAIEALAAFAPIFQDGELPFASILTQVSQRSRQLQPLDTTTIS